MVKYDNFRNKCIQRKIIIVWVLLGHYFLVLNPILEATTSICGKLLLFFILFRKVCGLRKWKLI